MYKLDLHTHSSHSKDGSITESQYENALSSHILDCIAITDHGTIDYAKKLNRRLGNRIIIGQEVMSAGGEIIGLFLENKISDHLSPTETIKQIKDQEGIVYIPHPLEKIRVSLAINILDDLAEELDIIEVGNGKSLKQYKYTQILVWANLNHLVTAASSDAHGKSALGHTYTLVSELPSRFTLVNLVGKGTPIITKPSLKAILYPSYNHFHKRYME